jgi:hypothetical protein
MNIFKRISPVLIGVVVLSALVLTTGSVGVEVLQVKATTLSSTQDSIVRSW